MDDHRSAGVAAAVVASVTLLRRGARLWPTPIGGLKGLRLPAGPVIFLS